MEFTISSCCCSRCINYCRFNEVSIPFSMGMDTFCLSPCRVEQDSYCAEYLSNQKLSMRSGTYDTSPLIPKALIKQKYLSNRISIRDIAREFSCSKTRIRSQLLKYGILLREPNKYHKDHWRIYGKRWAGGKAVDHKGQLRTITTIKQMYSEGVNTVAIARLLDTMKIPTKQQGEGWDHSMVTAILKREGVYVERRRAGRVRGRC